jgi:hypothetical protein
MANTYINRAFSSSSTNTKATWSFWVKRAKLTQTQFIFHTRDAENNNYRTYFRWYSDDSFSFIVYNINGTQVANVQTNRLFRDTSAWYHIVVRMDTTQGNTSDRIRIYVNGVQETSMANSAYPANGQQVRTVSSNFTRWGFNYSTYDFFNGSLSHIHFIEGEDRTPDYFGETDSTTGEWKIKTNPTGFTYGSNGYFILKDGNSLTDQSGNSNNFTVGGGTLTKTEDNPSNVFCTWNPNYRSARKDMTLTNGNTFISQQNSGDSGVSGTMAVSSGKYYWEQIIAQVNGTNAAVIGGLHTVEDFNESPTDALSSNTCGLRANGNAYKDGNNLGNFTSSDPNGDIFGIAFDADNGSVYYWKNGTALNSGNAVITGLDMTKTWVPFGVQHGGNRVTTSTNFGNGYFGTTAVSSAGTNASNNGIFEYDVPSGYTALSTKGLNL